MQSKSLLRAGSRSALIVCAVVVGCAAPAWSQNAPAPGAGTQAASTDFLSDEEFRKLSREERRKLYHASYVARFEPGGKAYVERLDQYVDRFAYINIYDRRLTVFDVKAEHQAGTTGTVALTGEVLFPQYRKGIQSTLELLGFNVASNDIVVLPAAQPAEEIFAVSAAAAATVRKEPRRKAEQITSVGMGGWVRLLRKARTEDAPAAAAADTVDSGAWYLAQTSEGYVGFMREDELHRTSTLIRPDGMTLEPTTVTLSADSGEEQIGVPAGAFVRRGNDGGYTLVQADAPISRKVAVAGVGKPAFTEEEILSLARPLMGVKYVWGGVTDRGIDCSGFTQFMLRAKGITLPRDAEEQATVGQIVAFGEDVERAAEPGDLVFFANDRGKISHIAMSLGGGRIIHSSKVDVHISRLRDGRESADDSQTLLERVVFARRIQGR